MSDEETRKETGPLNSSSSLGRRRVNVDDFPPSFAVLMWRTALFVVASNLAALPYWLWVSGVLVVTSAFCAVAARLSNIRLDSEVLFAAVSAGTVPLFAALVFGRHLNLLAGAMVGIVMAYSAAAGASQTDRVLSGPLMMIASLGYFPLAYVDKHVRQIGRHMSAAWTFAYVSMGHTFKPFAFYARPFAGDGTLTQDITTRSAGILWDPGLDWEAVLARSLRRCPLIGLGEWFSEAMFTARTGAGLVDLSMMEPKAPDWFDSFKLLAENARFIVTVAAPDAGTLMEIDTIRKSGWLEKTVFVMPEAMDVPPNGLRPVKDHPGVFLVGPTWAEQVVIDHATRWQELQTRLGPDLSLPEYRRQGGLFVIRKNGTVRLLPAPWRRVWFPYWRTRRTISKLLRDAKSPVAK